MNILEKKEELKSIIQASILGNWRKKFNLCLKEAKKNKEKIRPEISEIANRKTTNKSNEIKPWFFEKIKHIEKF